MRIFVALNLPDAVRKALTDALRPFARLPALRPIAPDALHLTLHFLGHVDDRRVETAADIIAAVAPNVPAFPLHLAGVGAFPNVRRPRVWWVGVSSPPELVDLQRRMQVGFAQQGFRTEERPFRPHLTVGRVRDTATRDDLRAMADAAAAITFEESFPVTSVELMRSELRREGARYSVVRSWPLATQAD